MKKSTLSALSAIAASLVLTGAALPDSAFAEDVVTVLTTEKVPGAECTPVAWSSEEDVTKRRYECKVEKGFGAVTKILATMIRYVTYITGLLGILMIVLSGIQYSLSGGGEDAKKAKGRIVQLATGLALLFLMWLILNSVAPWIYRG